MTPDPATLTTNLRAWADRHGGAARDDLYAAADLIDQLTTEVRDLRASVAAIPDHTTRIATLETAIREAMERCDGDGLCRSILASALSSDAPQERMPFLDVVNELLRDTPKGEADA